MNKTTGLAIVKLLLDRGANPNTQLFFKPANLSGATNTRGATPLIRAANNGDVEVVKLLLDKGADATIYMADRQTPIHAVIAGRSSENAGAGTDRPPAQGRYGRQCRRADQPPARRSGAARRCTMPFASGRKR